MKRALPALLALTWSAHFAAAQLSPADAPASFQMADDVRLELIAAEPLVASPCALSFDPQGALFVAENRGYPNTESPPQGVIARLEDTDGDGRMDRRTVYADGLTYPNGVLAWRGGVIVTCAPDVLFLADPDAAGRARTRRVLLTGFDTKGSTQLRVNAPTLGPDGWIYLAAGLSGGTLTCPEHPERTPLKMTGDVRFHPETLEVENVDGRSQYGQSFDDFGRRFICMNRLPVQHVVLSSKWLARNPRLAFSETVQDCSARSVRTGLRGDGDGVALFPISANITTADSHAGSFSAACGIHLWRGGALPARYDGAAFSCDPTGNLVHVDRLEPREATFAAVPLLPGREFLASRDDYFRPVFLTRGPEGALYVADMYRRVIEHPDYLPEEVRRHTDFETGKTQGRIWRVTAKEPRPATPLRAFRDERTELAPEHPRSALYRAVALGNDRSVEALPALARLAAEKTDDRWMRAAVLSGIAGREANFLRALWPVLRGGEGELELLEGVGRSFADPTEALRALPEPEDARAAQLAALLLQIRSAEQYPMFSKLIARAARALNDPSTAPAERMIFIRLLGRGAWESAAEPLRQIALRTDDETQAAAAIQSLVSIDAARATKVLLAPGAWERYSPVLRETLLTALLAPRAAAPAVLEAVEIGALPLAALTEPRRQALSKNPDPALHERAVKLFATTATSREAALARAGAALSLAGKAGRGRLVFRQTCAVCHRLDREGVSVGPDLLDIRRHPKENILFHIVAPDAEIAPAFAAYTCETKDGRAFTGILTSSTAGSVTLRQPGGSEETILRGEVKTLTALAGSLMPTGLDAALSPQQLADLLAFLKGETEKP